MVISLYAKGLTTRDIASYMRSHYGMELSQPAVSGITDKVYPLVKEWLSRPLAVSYPIVYLDGLHFKVRDAGKIVSKIAYIVLGINPYGNKEVLGIWISDSEGAKFWMHVLNDLKNRGVDDILIACVDGLKGFPDAVKSIYPQTEVQVCIAHQIRNTIKFLPIKDREGFCRDLREVYTASTESAGLDALHTMMQKWPQYRGYLKSWEDRWAELTPFFEYPNPIRRMVYTTNMIENLNRQFRKVTKTTTIFPHDESLMKLLWLAQNDLAQGRLVALRNWSEVMAQLSILFGERVQF
ncbi:IS256 family transposase [Patescibacteria group bacterium]|nr:IS256 family transposase [Patescibacteria group bacterium]